MESLFKYLGYDVEVHTKLNKESVLQVFDKIGERIDHSKYDSFVCCILSFGSKERKLYGSDNVPFSIDSIIANLKADSCKTLKGKPKIFFCSGKSWDERTRAR